MATALRSRGDALQHGLKLEYLTVAWNVVEGVVAITVGLAAASVALLGFGLDSAVETASGLVLIWRLRAERRLGAGAGAGAGAGGIARIERRAQRLVAASLFALAIWIAGDAIRALVTADRPSGSPLGVIVTSLSLGVMWWLARAKRRVAVELGSRAMAADAFQTTACWWLSLSALSGLALNAACGWWWADPLAALVMTVFLVREGREAWRGEGCGCAQAC